MLYQYIAFLLKLSSMPHNKIIGIECDELITQKLTRIAKFYLIPDNSARY